MLRLLRISAFVIGSFFAGVVAFGGGVPSVPVSPTFSEPSQIVPTLNTFIAMLNGNPTAITGGASPGIVSLGNYCTNTAGASPQTCNGVRGAALFTGITVAATGTTQTLTINNSAITAASVCLVQPITAFTAGSGVAVATAVPAAGSVAVTLVNAGTTSNAVTTGTLGFSCVQ